MKKNNGEHQEQVTFFDWVRLNRQMASNQEVKKTLKLCYAVPNGGARDVRTGKQMKAEGVTKGMPDINLDWPSTYIYQTNVSAKQLKKNLLYTAGAAFIRQLGEKESILTGPKDNFLEAYFNGLRIEMKFGKNTLSPEQNEKKILLEDAGFKYVICYSAAEAARAVFEYLPFEEKDYQGIKEFLK